MNGVYSSWGVWAACNRALLFAQTNLSKPEAVGTVGTGGRVVAEGAAGVEGACLPEPSPGMAAGATAAAGATTGPPLAASAAAVFC